MDCALDHPRARHLSIILNNYQIKSVTLHASGGKGILIANSLLPQIDSNGNG
jgi:hypothetical protein